MFQYFPRNYVWSANVVAGVEHGGKLGEIDEMCRPLLEIAEKGDDPGTEAFYAAWKGGADRLIELAREDQARGRLFSAGDKLNRAAVYYVFAERMQAHGFEARLPMYKRALELFHEGVKLSREQCTRIEIPYGDTHLAALHVRARGRAEHEPAPCVVVINGLDSTKEMLYRSGLSSELPRRGVSVLFVDQPGTGEALRLHGLTALHDTERWASPIVDFLEQQPGVDPRRIGALGVSLGGYYATRAVAFEPRFAAGAVWGANHNWGEVQQRRRAREGENPVPHYWRHVQWVWGAKDIDDFMRIAAQVHLNGVAERVRVPFLVTHGEKDRQIPLQYAHQTYDQLVNSPQRELKIFTAREGGVEHSSMENPANAGAYLADWLAEALGGHTG